MRDDLASSTLSSASAQALSLTVLVDGLTPGAQLAQRCAAGQLPPAVTQTADVCQSASVKEITDEQETYVDLRRVQQDARALVTRLDNQLEGDKVSREWAATATALRNLQRFESSTTCNADRSELVTALLDDPDAAFDRHAWLDSSVTYFVNEGGRQVEHQAVVRDVARRPAVTARRAL